MANRWGNNGKSNKFYFLGLKITVDDSCSHEIKRCLLLGRKAMTNLDGILKSRGITLPTKVHIVKAIVFPVVMMWEYRCESWTIRKAECWRIDAFELWCWVDSLESLGQQGDQTSQSERESTLNIHWKDWCWNWSSSTLTSWCKELTHWKRPWFLERLRAGGAEDNRDEMVGWHHWLSGHGLSKLWEIVKDREAWCAAVNGVTKSFMWLSEWTTTNIHGSKVVVPFLLVISSF